MTSKKFEEALKFVDRIEAGYVNDPKDPGGPTKYGITQKTYNNYRNKKNLNIVNVKYLEKPEAKKIYYEEYWIPSGAENYKDPKMSLAVFDTEVNHGHGINYNLRKKSGGNFDAFITARVNTYKQDKNFKIYGEGWMNRVAALKKEALIYQEKFIQSRYKPPKSNLVITHDVDNIKSITHNNLLNQSLEKHEDLVNFFEARIYQSMLDSSERKRIEKEPVKLTGEMLQNQLELQNEKKREFLQKIQRESNEINKRFTGKIPNDYQNPELDNNKIFTKEEIDKMSWSDLKKYDKAIKYQKKTIGIPTKEQAAKTASQKGSGLVHVTGYVTASGRRVDDYYRARPYK